MSKFRGPWLLATASSVTFAGFAQAQSAPPLLSPTTSWTGFYAGINLGQARHHATTTDVNNYSGVPPGNYVTTWFDSTKKSFTYGGQVGYNWQHKMLVVGVEADINHVGAKTTFAPADNFITAGCATCVASATNELKWLATFRGRAGIAIQQFLVYGTAGLAVGRVANRWGFGVPGFSFSDSQFSVDETRTGVVYGGGAEFAPSPHWIVRAEGLRVDLGTTSQTINTPNPVSKGTGPFRTDFKNTATIGRFALNYKW
jgi:outer membrane immunogenic protein